MAGRPELRGGLLGVPEDRRTWVRTAGGTQTAGIYKLLRFIGNQSEQVKRTVSQVSVGGGENG